MQNYADEQGMPQTIGMHSNREFTEEDSLIVSSAGKMRSLTPAVSAYTKAMALQKKEKKNALMGRKLVYPGGGGGGGELPRYDSGPADEPESRGRRAPGGAWDQLSEEVRDELTRPLRVESGPPRPCRFG